MSFLVVCLLMPSTLSGMEEPDTHFVEIPIGADALLLSAALEAEHTDLDCSHLVHYLYQRSGLDYTYANSMTLYQGVKSFRRVTHPQTGDLIVWRGHVGIVVDPQGQTFISALRTGVKVSSYVSHYWKMRGVPRFLHYIGPEPSMESSVAY